jgi:acid phosphatase type 7
VAPHRLRLLFISLLLAAMLVSALIAGAQLAPTAAASGLAADPVIAAAGDIACDPASSSFNGGNGTTNNCRQKYTSDLLLDPAISSVLLLGDNQYYCGSYQAWLQSYDKSWGRVKGITRPAPGNHEYLDHGGSSPSTDCNASNAGAAGYYRYFGAAAGDPTKGYYSYDVGSWHIIVLNSECTDAGGCSATTPQGIWLRQDLAAHTNFCTLAYWHIPLFSSGGRASSRYRTFWDALYAADADVVLNGHDHIYERFAPQRPDATADPVRGIREFVVGTGGSNHTSLSTTFANSQVRNASTYGVLKLTLHAQGYDWQFVPEAGKTFTDAGTGQCHGSTPPPPDTEKPTAPSNLTATATGSQVALSWTASSDNVGVAGYDVLRNGTVIATPPSNSYTDATVSPNTTYTYVVRARDAAGNVSDPSNTATVTTPPPPTVLTFTPSADAYVEAANPTSTFGSGATIQVDNSPVKHFLVKFTVTGVGGRTVTSAKLRLHCVDPATSGGDFHRLLDTSWSETSVNWNNAPAAEPAVFASLGSVVAGNWYEVNLPFVTGDGTYAIRVTSTSTNGADYSSKDGAFPPQVVVTAP